MDRALACKGSVAGRQHSAVIRRGCFKVRLTLWFYCGKEGSSEATNRWRAAQFTGFAGFRALVRRSIAVPAGVDSQPRKVEPTPAAVSNFPIASDARLAGDAKQTRFVLDLDKPIHHRAFVLADPYRVVIDMPQVSFRLPAGVGTAGRGLIKAFRYGLVMPGGSRIVFDLAGTCQDRQLLRARCRQRPAVAAGAGAGRSRSHHVRAVACARSRGPNCGPRSRTPHAAVARARRQRLPRQPADPRPVVVIDPGHGGPDNGTQSEARMEKNIVLTFALALRDRIEKAGKYRVVMTRTDDTFIPLDERVKVARKARRLRCSSRSTPTRCRGARAMRRARPSTRCPTRPPTPRPNGWRKRKTRPTPSAGSRCPRSPWSPTS